MLLSAAIIARDEEQHLGACLESISGVVDEVVVVDTGSVDRTVEIACRLGACVHRARWSDDFSAARNVALDHVRGRWVLYIDADERLRPVSRAALVDLLGAAEEVGFRLLLHPARGWTAYREYRLWRNDPRIRFRGVIHEKVRPSILDLAARERRAIGDADLRLDHVGYLGDQARKHRRNLPLLRAELALRPETIFNWRHLGVALAALGELDEAERALERAVELARRAPADDVHGSIAFAELVRLQRRRGAPVGTLLAEALEHWPEQWLLVWMRARQRIEEGRHELALGDLDRLLAVDLAAVEERGIAYDGRLFGVFAHTARGRCLLVLDRPEEAAAAYAAAERCEPGERGHTVRRQLAEAVARRRARRSCAPSPQASAPAARGS